MKTVIRYDRATLRRPEKTPQGFLRVDGLIARPGIYEYVNTEEDAKEGYGPAGSIRRELRPRSEVTKPEALARFDGISVTLGHPRKPNGDPQPVTAANVKQFEVGTVMGEARQDGDVVAASLLIKDAAAIRAVEHGKQELSPGHAIDLEKRSGVDPEFGRYDAIQFNIRPNHLALVDRARGGSKLRLRMDEAEQRVDGDVRMTSISDGHQHLIDTCPPYGSPSGGDTSWAVAAGAENGHSHPWVRNADGTITIGESAGHSHSILDNTIAASLRSDAQIDQPRSRSESVRMDPEEQIRSLKAQLLSAENKLVQHEADAKKHAMRADEAEAKLKTATDENSELRTQIAAAATVVETEAITREKVRADEAEAKIRSFDSAFASRVKDRVALERRAAVVMGPEFRMDDLSDREVRATVVKRLDAQADTSAAVSDGFLAGRFESLIDLHARNARSQQRVADIITTQNEQRVDSLEEKRKQMRERWKEPLSSASRHRKEI